MIEFTPAEERKSEQLRQSLLLDGRDKIVPDRIVQKLMGKFKAPFAEVEKAIRMALVLPLKDSPLTTLTTVAFQNGRCVLQYPAETKPHAASSPQAARYGGYVVHGYDRAFDWFNSIGGDEARHILAQISRRLMELNQPDAAQSPLDFGSGRVLLVHWFEYCTDPRKQELYRTYWAGERRQNTTTAHATATPQSEFHRVQERTA